MQRWLTDCGDEVVHRRYLKFLPKHYVVAVTAKFAINYFLWRFLGDECRFLFVSGYSEESTATATVSIGMTCHSDKTDLV